VAELPGRTADDEDGYVRAWSDSDDTDGLIAAIEAAVDARRPMLAARLVQLLDEHVEIEPGSALERASRAARLILTHKATPEDNSWSALEDAWREVRQSRMRRIRQRMRDRLEGKNRRVGRLDRKRR
jgi:hypothetical protein